MKRILSTILLALTPLCYAQTANPATPAKPVVAQTQFTCPALGLTTPVATTVAACFTTLIGSQANASVVAQLTALQTKAASAIAALPASGLVRVLYTGTISIYSDGTGAVTPAAQIATAIPSGVVTH